MPDAPALAQMNNEQLTRRATMASMITSPIGGQGAAPVAGKQVLGA